jgi:hypothetical protein
MKILFTLVAALFLSAGVASADPVNKLCPVSGKDGDPALIVKYAKKIGFCCDKCKAKFEKDPASFAEKIAAYKTDGKKCIISDKDADAEQTVEYKADVSACCEKCEAKIKAEPDKFIAKALKKS